MKRICLFCLLCALAMGAGAQKTVQGSGFLDDWSVSAAVGAVTPMAHSSFWKGMRPVYGVEMSKCIVPEFALGAQCLAGHRLTQSGNVFDVTNLMLLGHLNLSNLMAGYMGRPRSFELIATAGAGWGHHYYNEGQGEDLDFVTAKFGLGFKFFLDRKRYAWALEVRPAVVYDLAGQHSGPSFQARRGGVELMVGMTYHFKNSNNGKHHFTLARLYDPARVDALNAKINGLRQVIAAKDAALKELQEALAKAREKESSGNQQ